MNFMHVRKYVGQGKIMYTLIFIKFCLFFARELRVGNVRKCLILVSRACKKSCFWCSGRDRRVSYVILYLVPSRTYWRECATYIVVQTSLSGFNVSMWFQRRIQGYWVGGGGGNFTMVLCTLRMRTRVSTPTFGISWWMTTMPRQKIMVLSSEIIEIIAKSPDILYISYILWTKGGPLASAGR